MNTKRTFIFAALVLISFAPHALAQGGFVPLAGIPGLTQNVDATMAGLAAFFNNLYKYLIGVAATLAVIEIIWGGFEISTKDSMSKQADGKERITQALFGLVLVLSPVLVFSIINPSILNLSLDIPILPLKTTTSTSLGAGGSGTAAPIQSNVSGCMETSGPAPGTVLATCSARDVSAAQAETQTFISTNCTGNDKVGGVLLGACSQYINQLNGDASGGSVSSVCGAATALAFCSPIVTVNTVQTKTQNPDYSGYSYTNWGYFGDGNSFAQACSGGQWSLQRNGGVTQDGGTPINCPTSDPGYQGIISGLPRGTTNVECASVPMYCLYSSH